MAKVVDGPRLGGGGSVDPVCSELKAVFDSVAAEPMPDQLAILAERLQDALERGELFGARSGQGSR